MKNIIMVLMCLLTMKGMTQQKATISEFNKVMKTYPFSDPNPVPNPESYYYPYFRFDGLTQKSIDKKWKTIELENDYIKVSVLPELGGKIWGAIEKSTGYEFIHENSVVEFRDLAMRGAWTAGGIELNFGIIGHTPTTSTPVDYLLKENEDGSVSCFVSAMDLFTRTRWETEINLPKDKAYFTTHTVWHNSTPLVQPYYHWMNASYPSEGDLECCFPGSHRIGHSGELATWPIDEKGRDLSWYKNNAFGDSKAYHILGSINDYFAGYWHDLDFGSGHYSQYGDKLGQKIFQWEQSDAGAIWEDLLTDTDGQYVELQSGRLFNQAGHESTRTPFKHHGFEPYATDVFEEYWFPVLNTKGVKKANYYGVFNVEKFAGEQIIYFCPLQKINDRISIYYGNDLVKQIEVNLDVLENWSVKIDLNKNEAPLKIVLGDKKLGYSEKLEDNQLNRPLEAPVDFNWNSAYGLFLDGQQWMYQNKFGLAKESFEKCLKKDPCFGPALTQMSVLCYRNGDYKKGLTFALKSLSINTYDAEANFNYGLLNKKLGNLLDARDGFSVASLTSSYRDAAHIELAKLMLFKDDLGAAESYAAKVINSNQFNLEANRILTVIYRKRGQIENALCHINRLKSIVLLNHFANFEDLLVKNDSVSKLTFLKMIRSELPEQTYLEMSQWYEDAGCKDEAVSLLKIAPSNPLVFIKLAYLNRDDSKVSAYFLGKAMEKSPNFILPFRPENLDMLSWAVTKTDDWKAKYYLGLLHWRLFNKSKAKELFLQCGNLSQCAPFYTAKSALFRGSIGYDAERDLLKAKSLDSNDWRNFANLTDYYLSKNSPKSALAITEASLAKFPENDVIKYNYALCLMADGQFSACRKALAKTTILPTEGARYGRVTYQRACLMESIEHYKKGKYNATLNLIKLARLWPPNLGAGIPYNVDERIEDIFKAECLLKKGKEQEPKKLYHSIISYTEQQQLPYSSIDYFYLVALKRLDKRDRIEEFLQKWEQSSPDDPLRKWCKYMIESNIDEAIKIEEQIDTKEGGSPWDPKYSDPEFEIVKYISKVLS